MIDGGTKKYCEKNQWKILRLMQSICDNAVIIVHYGITSIAPSIAICATKISDAGEAG